MLEVVGSFLEIYIYVWILCGNGGEGFIGIGGGLELPLLKGVF